MRPAGEWLTYHSTNEEAGKMLHNYWTNACVSCVIKEKCTTGKERRIRRWEHEDNCHPAIAGPHEPRCRVRHPFERDLPCLRMVWASNLGSE